MCVCVSERARESERESERVSESESKRKRESERESERESARARARALVWCGASHAWACVAYYPPPCGRRAGGGKFCA